MKFELKLDNRNVSVEELLKDLNEVAKKLGKDSLTKKEYTKSKLNRFSGGTIAQRCGGWNNALKKAGLKVLFQQNVTDDELLDDLKRVAQTVSPKKVTQSVYKINGKFNPQTIRVRLGGWNEALKKTGLAISVHQNITDEELFNNLEEVWIKIGKQPGRRYMIPPFSKYSERPYLNRFGSWRKALESFIEHVNQEKHTQEAEDEKVTQDNPATTAKTDYIHKTKRDINLRLRFLVMKRDNFKCKNCGRSPATDPKIILHIDHINAWANGGETVIENLQTLCSGCNLGKSNL
jgi:hypothetical protein